MGISPLDAYAAVIAGVCTVSYLYFGFYLLPPSSKDPRFKPLLLACFSWSAWSLCYLLYFLSRSDAGRGLYLRFAYAGMLTFVLLLEFVMRYTRLIQKERTARFVFAAIWLPPLLSAGASLAANAVARDFPSGFWFLYAEIQTFLYNAAAVIFMLLHYLRHKTRRSRAQVYVLCGSATVLMVLSWAADYYLDLRNGLNVIPAWLLVWIGVLLHMIRKHGFLPAIPDQINRDITENIEEGILLLDLDLKTIFQNGAARRFLNAREGGSVDLLAAVSERRALSEGLRKLAETEATCLKVRVNLIPAGSGMPPPMDLMIKKVNDSDGNPSGYLAILSIVKNAQFLKATYGITRREMEVLLQLANGATNKEMADLLDISEKTIETHVGSIYGKMMVRNRVELLKLLSEAGSFRLVPAEPPDAPKGLLVSRPQ